MMMRTHYLQQLSELEDLLGKMGGLIVGGLADARKAMETRSDDAVRAATNVEARTDAKLDEIDRLCSLLLLTQQPVASDMRFIVSVMNIVVDMERIGDQTRDIAETARKCKTPPMRDELVKMADCCTVMLSGALDAFIGRDVERARKMIDMDDVVDEAFDQLQLSLSENVKKATDVGDLLNFLMIGKYLERIADHATNIAEWTNYVVTGTK